MVAVIFLVAMLSSILLSLMGALPFWASALITAACLTGLGFYGAIEQQQRNRIRRRCRQLQARWGQRITHLGGLSLPLETKGVLYLLEDDLLLETENDHFQIPHDSLRKILILSAEQIRRLSDKRLCDMLATGNVRSFSSLREKIRHRDRAVRGNGILMLAYKLDGEDIRLLVLSTLLRLPALTGCFRDSGLPSGKVGIIDSNGKSMTPVV